MSKELEIQVIELSGSSQQIGFKQGTKRRLTENDHAMLKMQKHINIEEAFNNLRKYDKEMVYELTGLAKGLQISSEEATRLYGGYDVAMPFMGCSAFGNDSFYVRNYDFSTKLYDAQFVLLNPDKGYASAGFSQQLTGRLDGMNEKGLVAGIHLVHERKQPKRFLPTTIARLVLNNCSTVQEAVDLIMSVPHGHCLNFSLTDQNGNCAIVEASPEKQISNETSPLLCTNHFETNSLRKYNRPLIKNSQLRKQFLSQISKEHLKPIDAYHAFNHSSSPLFLRDYKNFFGTLHTVVYSPRDLRIIIGVGEHCVPCIISFKDWLDGNVQLPKFIKGNINPL
ncbi:C45 family autoproteolytic acyltransferase/hydolase [Salinibacillus aidingensis]|uniref:C45 family autoproteolytic acyltransferase/hydolase n=1 Tax=Salinibacillus aidingensis TaxID=237684 RepID=A0ABN1BD08_9BACI